MKIRSIKRGLSLTELLVTMAVIIILFAIGIPASKKIAQTFDSSSNVKMVIGSALANARAIAIRDNTYVGLRFQADAQGDQYMILVKYDPSLAGGSMYFRALENHRPYKLPEGVIVFDMYVDDEDKCIAQDVATQQDIDEVNADLAVPAAIQDMTTFTVLFNKTGKMVINSISVSDCDTDDNVFVPVVAAGSSCLFAEDTRKENTRRYFVIGDKEEFSVVPADARYSQYFQFAEKVFINPYSGQVMK